MASEIKEYLDSTGTMPEDALIGRIVLFTISDEPIAQQDISDWFDELRLNPTLLPPPIKAVDAYKKATSLIDGQEYDLGGGLTATLLCRDVASPNQYIVRHVMREVRDSKNRVLTYDKVIEATFYRPVIGKDGRAQRGTERFRLTVINDDLRPGERGRMDATILKIEDSYKRYHGYLDGQKLRAVIRSYLKYLNAIEIKGGVYFINSNRVPELTQLQTLVSRFGGKCRMDLIPLVDLGAQRDMVVEAFQREAAEALNEIVQEVAHLRTTRKKITPKAYAAIRVRYDEVIAQAKEYLRTLGISQDVTAGAAELALDSLIQLQTDMLEGTP